MGAERHQRAGRTAERQRHGTPGFTLLEVIVALAIAGLALIGLFQAAGAGLFAADDAGRVNEAVERAQSHLAAFGRAGAIVAGVQEGDDGGGYHWQLSATPVATRVQTLDGHSTSETTLFDVRVAISWQAGGRKRGVVLDTRRLNGATGSLEPP